MTHKLFAERLNQELDSIDMPSREEDRIEAFSKMFHIPKYQADAMIHGISLPKTDLLNTIAKEFEVNPRWLSGEEEKRS